MMFLRVYLICASLDFLLYLAKPTTTIDHSVPVEEWHLELNHWPWPSSVRAITDGQTRQMNGQTDGRYQTYNLPCFAVDNKLQRPFRTGAAADLVARQYSFVKGQARQWTLPVFRDLVPWNKSTWIANKNSLYRRSTNVRTGLMFANFAILKKSQTLIFMCIKCLRIHGICKHFMHANIWCSTVVLCSTVVVWEKEMVSENTYHFLFSYHY